MHKEELKSAIDEGLTQRQIADRFGCSQTKVRHWLKKYEILKGRRKEGEPKKCSMCRVIKPLDQFFKREKGRPTSRCKACLNNSTANKVRDSKMNMIERGGGKCVRCGYKKCQDALEFHHRDPAQKDMPPSVLKKRNVDTYVLSELDKCDLLCGVCHREVHHEWTVKNRRIKPIMNNGQQTDSKCCTKCKNDLPKSMFYGFTGSADGLSWECKTCNYQRKTEHTYKIRMALLSSVGKKAKCELCGYDKYIAALDFHHVDQSTKELEFSRIQSIKFTQVQLDEMKKCQVLCVNCHREVHSKVVPPRIELGFDV